MKGGGLGGEGGGDDVGRDFNANNLLKLEGGGVRVEETMLVGIFTQFKLNHLLNPYKY